MRCPFATIIAGAFMLLTACSSGGTGTVRDQAEAGADPAAPVEALPAEVATVRTAGWWSDAGREGPYRIVLTEHGFDKIVSRLYVQWLQQARARPGMRVLGTVGFDRINEVPLYQLAITDVRELPEGLEVELEGTSLYTGETQGFLLRAGGPEDASLRVRQ